MTLIIIIIIVIVHLKRLGSRGFHDLFHYYQCLFSKNDGFCKRQTDNFIRLLI